MERRRPSWLQRAWRVLGILGILGMLGALGVTTLVAEVTLPGRSHHPNPLRVAVANIVSPMGTLEAYLPLLELLSACFQRPVELFQRRTYHETNDLLRERAVEVAFVCTRAYVAGHDSFGVQLVAAPIVHGESTYHSVILVKADSPVKELADLRGRTFAFTDPLSHTGCSYPTYLLIQEFGVSPDSFLGRTTFTYSHDDAIQAVAKGVVDAAAVDELVLFHAMKEEPTLRDRLRVLHRSPPFTMPPVVTAPGVDAEFRSTLQKVLLELPGTPEGRHALQQLGFDGFARVRDADYDRVRDVARRVPVPELPERAP